MKASGKEGTTSSVTHSKIKKPKRSALHKRLRIYYRVLPSGSINYMVDCGKRIKPRFKTFSDPAEAEGFAMQIAQQKDELGTASFQQLSPDDRLQLTYAKERLAPYSANIKDAIDYYVERHLRFRNSKTLSEIIDALVAKVASKNRRPRTVQSLRSKLALIKAPFGDRKLTDLPFEEIEKFIGDASN